MSVLILDGLAAAKLIEDRRAQGLDRFDEVWDGVYVMSPLPEWYHQEIVLDLAAALKKSLSRARLGRVVAGCNISDRNEDWSSNYRCPDVVVFLETTQAIFRGAHWQGGPDFAAEVVSDNDRTWDKLDFYASLGTRELLIVDRNPWKLSLLQLLAGKMTVVGESVLPTSQQLSSGVIPFSFCLVLRYGVPAIEIKHRFDGELSYAPELPPLKPAT
jgi:Uma2 family endonuclease